MTAAALALYAVWFGLPFGVRIALQVRRAGSTARVGRFFPRTGVLHGVR